jgi:Bifunctional DNA primase/polymerase, N-terminal
MCFSSNAQVPNSASRLSHGVDVRGANGYVVAAPSVHPTGRAYTIVRDLPIAEAPRWLVDLAMPDEQPVPPPGPMPMPAWCCEDAKLRAIPGILSLLANARKGERNQITFWAACRFSEMVRAGLITQSLAEDLLLQGASRCGLNGMEILSTGRSASKQGAR